MQNDYLLPLVLGVTGHRNINPGNPALAAGVQSQLNRLKRAFPHSPFILLSSLAEGADQLVARLALECLDARLIVPLPFSETEYRRDFATLESQREFTALLGRAESVFLVAQKEEAAALARPGESRNRQYARAGAWIAENAQILLAIWDGQPARGLGGTGDVVKWHQRRMAPKAFSSITEDKSVLAGDDPGFVILIHPETGECRNTPVTAEASLATGPFGRIDRFNMDAGRLLNQGGEPLLARSQEQLFRDQGGHCLLAGNRSIQELLHWFAMADSLAGQFEKRQGGVVGGVAVLFFLAMTFSNQPGMKEAAAFYLVLMALIFLVAFGAKRLRLEDRYFDYRALAEGLRVAVFWRLCGIGRRVSLNYLSQHVGVVAWVREALRSVELTQAIPGREAGPTDKMEAIGLAETLWLRDQATYFKLKIAELNRRHKWLRRVSYAGFLLLSVVAGVKTVGQYLHSQAGNPPITHFLGPLGMLVAVGLAASYYDEKKSYATLIKRYTLSGSLQLRASEKLRSPDHPPEAVILQIGREALSENADWLWMQREMPLKPGA